MKVKELIEHLSGLDSELSVYMDLEDDVGSVYKVVSDTIMKTSEDIIVLRCSPSIESTARYILAEAF